MIQNREFINRHTHIRHSFFDKDVKAFQQSTVFSTNHTKTFRDPFAKI